MNLCRIKILQLVKLKTQSISVACIENIRCPYLKKSSIHFLRTSMASGSRLVYVKHAPSLATKEIDQVSCVNLVRL